MQEEKRYIALIVDDALMNREILKEILSDDLDIVEIDNGQDACEYMINHFKELSIVILDLIMPGMDGFEVLKFMKYKHMLDTLPVIMISADSDSKNIEKAFDLGVIDFLSRPFSERIVLRRVMTTIRLFKRQKELVDEIDRQYKVDDRTVDELTGLDYKQTFMNKVYTHLKGNPFDAFLMIVIDIDHFKLFNNYYGWEKGDEYLKLIAKYLKEFTQRFGGLSGYLGGDDFVLFCPNKKAELVTFFDMVSNDPELAEYDVGFSPKIGIYEVTDTSESVASIYDHAMIALDDTRGDYTKKVSWYDKNMVQKVRDEYELLVDIQRGIREREFTFFVQPKVDMLTKKLVGGEALVRWVHKDKGMVSPAVFIPVLEKNGFISQLDRQVWEDVAAWQKSWIDSGKKPVPISINVSRADIYTMDVTTYLLELLEKYNLPARLLEVEITESAYVDERSRMSDELARLREAGFTILMDDFGSGYSSLNSLKDLPVDILKIDMKFLRMDVNNINKGVSILESIVNMSRSLHMPTIVEGVETDEQVKFLTEMGCVYAQGYHFYRPLPIDEYERILGNLDEVDFDGIRISNLDPIHVREFLDENLFSDVVINNILGAVAFVEMKEDGDVVFIRMNEQYCKLTGREFSPERGSVENSSLDHFSEAERKKVENLCEKAYEFPLTGAEGDVAFIKDDGEEIPVHARVFFLRERPDAKVYYISAR